MQGCLGRSSTCLGPANGVFVNAFWRNFCQWINASLGRPRHPPLCTSRSFRPGESDLHIYVHTSSRRRIDSSCIAPKTICCTASLSGRPGRGRPCACQCPTGCQSLAGEYAKLSLRIYCRNQSSKRSQASSAAPAQAIGNTCPTQVSYVLLPLRSLLLEPSLQLVSDSPDRHTACQWPA